MASEAMDRNLRCPFCPYDSGWMSKPISGFRTQEGERHIKFFCESCGLLHDRHALIRVPRVVPPLIPKLMAFRSVQGGNSSNRVNLLAFSASSDDVCDTIRSMASGRAAGPDGLTYEMFKVLLDKPEFVAIMTTGISVLFTPEGLNDARVMTAFKGALTNFLPKPDKSDQDLDLIQNLRPITLRVAFFKIFSVLLKRRFTAALERAGTIDDEQQGFRCKRSARRAAHALQNLLWDARREGKKVIIVSLDWQNFFGSISQEAFLLIADMVGFSKEDVDLLRAFYADTALRVRTDGGTSAHIFLSRGFFQGDVLSPDAANLMSVLLIRMLKYSGNFYEHSSAEQDKFLNSIVFADDATIVVSGATNHEVQLRAQQLLDIIARFADFTDTELNTSKSFVTGYNFALNKELQIQLKYLGSALPFHPSTHTFRCLGIHFNCRLEGHQGKQIVLSRTKEFVGLLRNHFHDADQIDMVMRVAVIPIFRFSAPLLGWTDREMNTLHNLWLRGLKAAYGLSPGSANALFSLPRSHGGLECPHPSVYLMKECANVLNQMLDIPDAYRKICIHRTKQEIKDLGVASIREAQEDLLLAHTPTTRYLSPFLQMLYLSRRAGLLLERKEFSIGCSTDRRSIISFSFPERKELMHVAVNDPRKKQLHAWRRAAQRLAAAGIWSEEDILYRRQRRVDWVKIAEALHTDAEANLFVEILCKMGVFYVQLPEDVEKHEVVSKSMNIDGTPFSFGAATVLVDRRTRRHKPEPEKHRLLHLRHIRYRGRVLEILHKIKKHNPDFRKRIISNSFLDHNGVVSTWKTTRWGRLHQTALTGRFTSRTNAVTGMVEKIPLIAIERRDGHEMINTGLAPLPRHGFRHIPRTQAHFTYPPRTDFQIVRENPPSSFTEGSYQVLLQKEQAEIRNVQIMSDTWDPDPPQFAASREGIMAAWAKPLSLAPLISLPAARFHLMRSSDPGGLNLKVEDIVKIAHDYESREANGIRSWSPVIYQVIQHLFKLTHCVGVSSIVADPSFEHWQDHLPHDLSHTTTDRILIDLCGHHVLPFDVKSQDAVAIWVSTLSPNSVILVNMTTKWKVLSEELRHAKFHRVWRTLDLHVSIEKGSWRTGELRTMTHEGLIVWVADKLWNEEFLMDGDLKSHYDRWPNLPRVGLLQDLLAPDHSRLQLYNSFQQMNDIRWCGNLWKIGTDGSVRREKGTMGAGVIICPPDIRAMAICPGRCPCRQGHSDGRPASLGTIILRRNDANKRAAEGFVDRFAFRVDGELATARAEMAAILASLQAVSRTTSVAIGTDAESVLDILNHFRGKDSPPFLESMPNADLLGPILDIINDRMGNDAQTIFYKVRAHRGLALNEAADQQAELGHSSHRWIGEIREEEANGGFRFTKLDSKGNMSEKREDRDIPWSKSLQRRLVLTEAQSIINNLRQNSNKTADFMLRSGEGREFLGSALRVANGYSTSIMLKAISNTLPTKQNLHRWYPTEHVTDICDLCGQGPETVAHMSLVCSRLRDSTTAAHDKVRRRISHALEKGLARSHSRWSLHWEKKAGLAFPQLDSERTGIDWNSLTDVWVNLSTPDCSLDKLRPDGIHIQYDQSDQILQSVIFEFTRTNDRVADFTGDKKAQKYLRYEPLRIAIERITGAPCHISIFVMGICSSFVVKEWNEALSPYGLSDIQITAIFQAASHGALEALADQWRIRNVALALVQRSKFSSNATNSGHNTTEDSSIILATI